MVKFVIEFSLVEGDTLGQVRCDGTTVDADPGLEDVVEGYEPADFLERYDGWSNGYVVSKKLDEPEVGVDPSAASA